MIRRSRIKTKNSGKRGERRGGEEEERGEKEEREREKERNVYIHDVFLI